VQFFTYGRLTLQSSFLRFVATRWHFCSPSKIATGPVSHGNIYWMQLLAHFEELGDDRAAFLRPFVA